MSGNQEQINTNINQEESKLLLNQELKETNESVEGSETQTTQGNENNSNSEEKDNEKNEVKIKAEILDESIESESSLPITIDIKNESSSHEIGADSNVGDETKTQVSADQSNSRRNSEVSLNQAQVQLQTSEKAPAESINSSTTWNSVQYPSNSKNENLAPGSKRDRTVAEFTFMMDHYTPVIPDAAINYYLTRSGFDCQDKRVKRLLGLAAQKFLSDICNDAFQYSKIRTQTGSNKKSKSKKTCLNSDDLSAALSEYGINVKKPDYYI
ncbi:hypothetical protein K502DRAFT_321248 [Neoconidiobolus thromboides FSU 785]|nr:hypothetical protein K502DRAFT_321248 [Neoconidiobolus thromboides FSU 785]